MNGALADGVFLTPKYSIGSRFITGNTSCTANVFIDTGGIQYTMAYAFQLQSLSHK